jgi:hypothetical protein
VYTYICIQYICIQYICLHTYLLLCWSWSRLDRPVPLFVMQQACLTQCSKHGKHVRQCRTCSAHRAVWLWLTVPVFVKALSGATSLGAVHNGWGLQGAISVLQHYSVPPRCVSDGPLAHCVRPLDSLPAGYRVLTGPLYPILVHKCFFKCKPRAYGEPKQLNYIRSKHIGVLSAPAATL